MIKYYLTKLYLISYIFINFLLYFNCKKNNIDSKNIELINNSKIKTIEQKKNYGVGVVKVDRLRFRSLNDLHSKTLRYLDKGFIVTIISKDNKRVKIDDMEDYWYEIEYEGIRGWVFGYFIDIYPTYDDAIMSINRYKNVIPDNINISKNIDFNESINNLFFLKNGEIYKLKNWKSGYAVKFNTEKNIKIINFFFDEVSKENKIYYIGNNKNNIYDNNLYYLDISSDTNYLLLKNICLAIFYKENTKFISLKLKRILLKEYWIISIIDKNNLEEEREIFKVEKRESNEEEKKDILSLTMIKEFGTNINFEYDKKKNIIYFKPPELNKTYLITINTGEFLLVDYYKPNYFEIDSSRIIDIYSEIDNRSKTYYNIILKDKITGIEKNIIKSNLYPINFNLSLRNNFIAITMIDMENIVDDHYSLSIYVLSLTTYSLYPISTDGKSYQPKWFYFNL